MSPPIPRNHVDDPTSIRASAILTGTYVASSIEPIVDWRELVLLATVSAGDTGNLVNLIPMFSWQTTLPGAGDDVWFQLNEYDGSHTAATLGGTIRSGADFTLQPLFSRVTVKPLALRFDDSDAATDEYRLAIPLRTHGARWFQCDAADVKGSGTLSTLALSIVRTL